jgi:hypothetical protein
MTTHVRQIDPPEHRFADELAFLAAADTPGRARPAGSSHPARW